ncbi:MAG: hypothetical protein ACYC2H_06505 [Thermoplasmatota archaeon]
MVKVAVVSVLAGLLLVGQVAAGPLDEPPQNLQAARQGNEVVLTWDAVAGAQAYNVYRDGLLLEQSEDPSYSDQSASSMSTYWVTAILPDGETLPSNLATEPNCWGFTSGIPPVYVNPEVCIEMLPP